MPTAITEQARALWSRTPPSLRGITVMVISTVAFSSMHAAIVFVSKDLHPFQIAFFRNLFGLLIFIPVIRQSGLVLWRTDRVGMHILRSVLNVMAMLAFFTALTLTPLPRVTALSFTAPLFMALLAVLFLGERMYAFRWYALLLGFAGTLIILRPGVIPLEIGSLLVIGSAFIWSVTMVVIKKLSQTETSLTITGHMVLWLSLFSFIPALYVWQMPSVTGWLLLVFIGCCGTFAQLLLAEALKQADSTTVMPFDFLKLVWASLFGYFLFGQTSDAFVWIGAVLVFSAGMYVTWHERRRSKAASK
jgi:drug/metabolite transporter (DMT)-like permease